MEKSDQNKTRTVNNTGVEKDLASNNFQENNISEAENTQKPKEQTVADARFQEALINPIEQPLATRSTTVRVKKPGGGVPKLLFFFLSFFLFIGVLIFMFLKFRQTGGPILLGNKGEIIWWGVQHDLAVYKPLIDEFEKENPNIKIKYEKQSTQDYQERLSSALSSGKGPDIFEIHNTWPAMLKEDLSSLPSSLMTKDEFTESFYPVIVSNLTLDKGIVGMPLEYDALTLFINEDVFTSALKSPPETWDDLQKLAPQLTQFGDKNVIIQGGVALGITENVDHWPEIFGLMLYQNRVNPGKPTGELAADVFSFYKDFSKIRVWNNTLPNSTLAFSRGELAMYFGPTRRATEIIKANPNLKFRTVKLPQLPKNKPSDPNYSYATYWMHGVSEKSRIKEGAWIFLKFLAREDSLEVINENITKFETFGRVYPRPGMNADMAQDPIFGSIITFAYDAKSFYLVDNTYDGTKGINTLVNEIYKNLINDWPGEEEKDLEKASGTLSQILAKFGVKVR